MSEDSIKQLRVDLIYLAKRYKIIEDAFIKLEDETVAIVAALFDWEKGLNEWTDFITTELLKQGISGYKDEKALEKFKGSLRYKFKADYDKFESLFSKVEGMRSRKGKILISD